MRWIARAATLAAVSLLMVTSAWTAERLVLTEVDPALRGIETHREQESSLRYRFVQLSPTELRDTVVLNLFEDVEITAERIRERRQLDTRVWIGRVVGAPEGWAIIATNANGATFSKVVLDGSIYQIRPRGRGIHAVLELDPDTAPGADALEERVDDAVVPEIDFDKRRSDASIQASESVCDDAYSCGTQTIDIMIVYTSAARSAMGGTDASAQATIAAGVDEMNFAMSNSGVSHQYNLVHAGLVSYTESGNASSDLSRLRSQTDGFMDEIHGWRDQYAADLVSLITASGGCGIGYVGIDPISFSDTWGFNCVRVDCLTGNLTLAHEVGHNMGLQHDWYVSSDDRPCDWHHGYVNQAAFGGTSAQRWRTVMAYNTQCSDSGFNCTRLPYYSNPALSRDGDAMGTAHASVQPADAAYALTRTACKVAAYRTGGGPIGPNASFTTSPSSGDAPLAVSFDASSSTDDGTITSYAWDFGDGNFAAGTTTNHTFVLPGTYTVTLTVTDNDGLDDSATQSVVALDPSAPVDHVATSQQLTSGTVSGSYMDTHTNNAVAETVTEVTNGGRPSNRQSFMEIVWRFDVAVGVPATLHCNAWAPASSDGDQFELAYSTDGSSYLKMFEIAANTDDNVMQLYTLGALPSSPVWVRLRDTIQEPGNRSKDRVSIDHLFIRTNGGANVPAAPSALTATGASESAIDLAWSDNATNEDGFQIERSINGGSWAPLTTVGANASSHADLGLAAVTTYSYRVQAFNSDGPSGYSNIADATTTGSGIMVHVGALTGSGISTGKRWSASATVTVHDDAHVPVQGAIVSASWAGNSGGTATTDGNGACTFTRGGLKNGVKSIAFAVTDIQVAAGTYVASANDVSASVTIQPAAGDLIAADQALPARVTLAQNHPNPFNPRTTIDFGLPTASHVQLVVFDTLGRRIRTLVDAYQPAGRHSVLWDGRDQRGAQVATGIYIYRLRGAGSEITKRMILMK